MATATTFSSLSIPAPEDTMEVSNSPAHDNLYDDIELDFDDGNFDGGVQLQEDEHMLTDGEQTRPATATDDMMDDDVPGMEVAVPETEMQDTPEVEQGQPVQQEDEELIDYGDDEYYDQQQVEDVAVQDVIEIDDVQQPQGVDAPEQVDEEIVRQPEDASLEQPNAVLAVETFTEPVLKDVAQASTPLQEEAAYADQALFAGDENAFEVEDDNDQTLVAEAEVSEAHAEYAFQGVDEQDSAGDAELLQSSLSLDTNVQAAADAPGTPTDTGLHPMTVRYGEYEMPLFKSKRQLDGLLKDDNLASLSLAELMRNCKQRLALKIGNVPEDQELTLAFDHMGLLLLENSRAAYEHSLNDVLEVYVQLHQNGGTQEVPELFLTLSHQQFSNQLALLQQAAASGKGISDFGPREAGDEGEYYEDEDEETVEEGDLSAQQNGEDPQEQYYDGGEDRTGEEYAQNEENEEHEYRGETASLPLEGADFVDSADGQPGQETEIADRQEAPQEEAATTADDAEYLGVEGTANFTAEDALTYPAEDAAAEEDAENEKSAVSAHDSYDEVRKAESTASSHTVQGDSANGEYDEDDLIDWDEDSSLTSPPSELPADGHDEFSTILADDEADEAKARQMPTAEQPDHAHVAPMGNVPSVTEILLDGDSQAQYAVTGDTQQQILGSEDFLNDFDDEQQGTTAEGEQHHEDEAQEYTQNGDNYNQADTFDEQQDGLQPGEGEEQYDATHDFLHVESDENGLEHQAEGQDSEQQSAHNDQQTYQEENLYDDFLNDDSYEQEPETYPATAGQQGYSVPDPEDDIDFDDDTTEQHEARKASQHNIEAVTSGSPSGKRSFDEHADEGELDFDEPEMKKVRLD